MERTPGIVETTVEEEPEVPPAAAIMFNVVGAPSAGMRLMYVVDRDLQIPADALGSVTAALTGPQDDQEIAIQVDEADVGTITWSAGELTGTIVIGDVLLVSGQRLSLLFPDPADASWADVAVTLQANRGDNPGEEVIVGVETWNGRTGNVLPAAEDYNSDQIVNSSTVSGGTVSEALDFLGAAVAAVTTEAVQDIVGTMLGTAGTGLVFAYDDPAGTGAYSIDEATAANIWSNTADKVLTTDAMWSSLDEVALTDAATIAVDFATFINANVTLGGNRTLGAPTNAKSGQSGIIRIIQDGAGSRTLAYDAAWLFAGGTDPTLSTAIGAVDLLSYYVGDGGLIYASLNKGFA